MRCLIALGIGAAMACGPEREPLEPAMEPRPDLHAAATSRTRPAFAGAGDPRGIWQEAQRFYEHTGYQLAWSDGTRPRRTMAALVGALESAAEEGLDPAEYEPEALRGLRTAFDPATAAAADLRFTYAYIKYGWHLSRGRKRPEQIDRAWRTARPAADLAQTLETALRDNDVAASLKGLAPDTAPYRGLRDQLARHRALAAAGQPAAADATGLSVEDRIRLIEVNMDRWRWLPDDLGPRFVFVNIPAFRLEVFEGTRIGLDMKVVAGRKGDPTPVLADQMTHVVFSPFWNIPATIVASEIMPRLEADPDYLDRNNIEMVGDADTEDVRFRQRPGAANALGLVKFMFPNNFAVYLHDTPADRLFNRVERDFSHGCVRVERPDELARYVLRDQPEWTVERIRAAMHAGRERTVKLSEPLPVYLAYFTAWEDNGTLQVRPDVYGHDRRHLK